MRNASLQIYREERLARIWLINLFFGPGMAPTGLFLESLAVELDATGHDVEVLAGRAAYHTSIHGGEPRFRGKVQALFSGPIQVKNSVGKLLSWLCFYVSVACYLCTHRLPDKILVMTTPPFLHFIVAFRNLWTTSPAEIILWNQDTYPEVFVALEIVKQNSWVDRLLGTLQRWSISRVDKVIALDRAMRDILVSQGAKNVRTIPHWDFPPGDEIENASLDASLLDRMQGYRHVVIYTGNLGWGHDLSALWCWWRSNPDQKDFFFLFLGGGEQWEKLRHWQESERRADMEVLGYLPRAQYDALVARADLGLVALGEKCAGLMSPSKIHAYLGHGKPLLYLGPARSNVAEAIDQYACGFRCSQGDSQTLGHCLEFLSEKDFDLSGYRANALRAVRERYNEGVGVQEIRSFIMGQEFVTTRPAYDSRLRSLTNDAPVQVIESRCA